MSEDEAPKEDGKALQLANWLLDKGTDGFGPFVGAATLAQSYLDDMSYADNDERAHSLIKWEASKNVTTGFVTGIGGIATLPVAIPAGFGAAWLVQARLAAGIAHIHGHDIKDDRVRTLVLMSILGDATLKEPIKVAGKTIAQKALQSGINSISGKALTKINQAIGFRLLTKAGTKGVINLTRFVPVLGGVVGGAFDGATCYAVGKVAQKIFSPSNDDGPADDGDVASTEALATL
jgi:hypothetical protein